MVLSDMGWVLSPFYDLINVKIILPKDTEDIALLLGGKKENFNKGYFDRLGSVLKLNEKQITTVYRRLEKWLTEALPMIESSFLDTERKEAYANLISNRARLFTTIE